LQGLCGAVIGIIVGCLVAVAASMATYPGYLAQSFPLAAVLRSVAVALVMGLVIAVVTSVWPALVAARKRPVDALRVEE
jgi:ABC-type lipoprotein release transport system permease subunit